MKCRSGARHIQVRRGERVLFEETRNLAAPALLERKQYLLNPGENAYYCTFRVEYAELSEMLADLKLGDLGLALRGPLLTQQQRDEEVRREYDRVVKQMDRARMQVVSGTWHDLEKCDFVLKRPPRMLETPDNSKKRSERTAILQISKDDFDVLKRARLVDRPSEDDLAKLSRTVSSVLP